MEQSAQLPLAIERGGVYQGCFGGGGRWKVSRLILLYVVGRDGCARSFCFVLKPSEADQRAAAAPPLGFSFGPARRRRLQLQRYHTDGSLVLRHSSI